MKNFLSKIKTERVYVFLILLFGMISVFGPFLWEMEMKGII